jgi:predicted transcriptional regulator
MIEESKTDTVLPFPKKAAPATSSSEKIWGKTIMRHGYTAVPSILIRAQSRLGINTTQMNIILQLLDYWIDPARKPFPTKKDIANRIGVTDKTVQLNIRELEQAGLITRQMRKTAAGDWNSNIYHLDQLIERVKKLEPEFQKEREEREWARKNLETPVYRRKAKP